MIHTAKTDDYARQSVEASLAQLEVEAAAGLSRQEAASRLSHYGYNEIEEKEEPLWHRVFRAAILSAPLLHALWSAVAGTLVVVYGFLVAPIGWVHALWIWGYAFAWLLLNDFVKLTAYRMLHTHSSKYGILRMGCHVRLPHHGSDRRLS